MLRLAEVSREEFGRDVRELNTKLITSFLGPDLEGTLRAQLEDLWGCRVFDNYGTNELGAGAFECQHRNGLHFMEDAMYLEDFSTPRPMRRSRWARSVISLPPSSIAGSCPRFATTCATSGALCRRSAATAGVASGAWITFSAAATTW